MAEYLTYIRSLNRDVRMLTTISGLISAEQVAAVRAGLTEGSFVDGRASTGVLNRNLKSNEEYQRPADAVTDADQIVGRALSLNKVFQDFALPAKLPPPMFNRYRPGMHYDQHIDTPILGERMPLRADLSYTIFLTPPEAYEGGELYIDTGAGEQAFKLAAGDAVVYSSGRLHRVAPVTQGERLSAIGWLQSRVRDESVREILFDLSTASTMLHAGSAAVAASDPAQQQVQNRLYKAYANLIRISADA